MQPTRTSTRRRSRVVLSLAAALTAVVTGALAPTAATAAPDAPAATAAEARERMTQAAQQLTVLDEQVKQAEETVAGLQQNAAAAADLAAAAQARLDAYEPQLRAIAQSGYAGPTQSRVAAFLTSESADDLVQQIQTIDLIADHTNTVIAEVAAAQDAAEKAQAEADAARAEAETSLAALEKQKADMQAQIDAYEADFARLSAQEQAAVTAAVSGPVLAPPPVDQVTAAAPSAAVATIIQTALAQVGDPYVWGGAGPDGFDCSGLTAFAYAAAGIALPHSSKSQSQMGRPVSRAELQPGDLVYFYSPVSHIALYIGDGKMVHARTFGQPVNVTSVDMAGYAGAVRIIN